MISRDLNKKELKFAMDNEFQWDDEYSSYLCLRPDNFEEVDEIITYYEKNGYLNVERQYCEFNRFVENKGKKNEEDERNWFEMYPFIIITINKKIIEMTQIEDIEQSKLSLTEVSWWRFTIKESC